MFYANLEVEMVDGKEVLKCFVKGKHFKLTERVFEDIFAIQPSASRPRRPISSTAAKIEILGEHAGVVTNHASYLDLPTRLLMLIVDWSIRPISGHLTRLTEVVAMIMHNVKHGNYANLGRIVVSHMASNVHHVTANLPYGMWLTPIFLHFGVDLSHEIETPVPVAAFIGERTLGNMGYEYVSHGVWRKKQGRQDEPGEESEEEERGEELRGENEPPQEDLPTDPAMRAPSSSSYLPYMARFDAFEEQARASREAQDSFYAEMRESQHNFYSEMRETQNNFYTEMRESQHNFYSAVDSRLSSLNDNMAGMNQFIQSYMTHHPADFPPPPPPSED